MVSIRDNTMDEVDLWDEENSVEYKVLMAYAKRTLPASKFKHLQKQARRGSMDGSPEHTQMLSTKGTTEEECEDSMCKMKTLSKKKKKKSWKKHLTPACLRPQKNLTEKVCSKGDPETVRTATIAKRLQRILSNRPAADPAEFRVLTRTESIETDGDDEEKQVQKIVQFLRTAGDKLEEEMTADSSLRNGIRSTLSSYNLFQRVTDLYLSLVAREEPETEEQSCKLALCVDVTTRLTAIDNHPMNKVMGFGAKYLQDNFRPWIQSQGGWEKAVGIADEEIE